MPLARVPATSWTSARVPPAEWLTPALASPARSPVARGSIGDARRSWGGGRQARLTAPRHEFDGEPFHQQRPTQLRDGRGDVVTTAMAHRRATPNANIKAVLATWRNV